MGRYNLLDEKWIAVICQDGGQTELVSLKELFANAQRYYDLAGEMKTCLLYTSDAADDL